MSAAAADAGGVRDIRGLGLQLLFVALVIGVPIGVASAPTSFRDGDVSWQVAAGEWIIRNGRIPTTDPFSFTAAGQPWVAMEWLSEVLYASAFKLAGYAGLAAVVAAALIALNAIIFFHLQRRASPTLLAATLIALSVVLVPLTLARPHVLAWPLAAAWTVLLLRAAENGRPPALWSALLLVLWTNIHASFPIAVPIATGIALDALIERRWANFRQWLLFACVSLVALMLNANGLAGLLQPFKTSTLSILPHIDEWEASTPATSPVFFLVLTAIMATLLWRRVQVPLGRLLLLLLLLAMALAHVRHQSLFMIVAACILPPLWNTKPTSAPAPAWLLAFSVPFLALRAMFPLSLPESSTNPRSLIAAIPPELRSRPVFNEYTFGGPLILAGIKPYIDGRAEIYGDAFVNDYRNIMDGDMRAFRRTAQRYGICWIMVQPSSRLLQRLESSGGSRRIYSDRIGVIAQTATCGQGR